jgi:hypothetical protein
MYVDKSKKKPKQLCLYNVAFDCRSFGNKDFDLIQTTTTSNNFDYRYRHYSSDVVSGSGESGGVVASFFFSFRSGPSGLLASY